MQRKPGRQRLTKNDADAAARARGGECLSETCGGSQEKLRWRCSEGHEWQATLANIRCQKSWCPTCATPGRPKLTKRDADEAARARGGECLSEACGGSREKLRWRCGEGHEWVATLASVRCQKSWCPACATPGRPKLTKRDADEVARARGGECLSETCGGSQEKLRWRCGEGHEWAATMASIRNLGTWCPACAVRGRPSLTKTDADKTAQERGGECLSEECTGSSDKLHWRCSEGHEWAATLASVRNRKTWCPHCKASAAEQRCRDLFRGLLGAPSLERRPSFTKTPASPYGLELDLYYPDHGLAVEVQGLQHQRWTKHFQPTEDDFAALQRRDALKKALCEDNDVVLLELSPDFTAEQVCAILRGLVVLP